MVKRILWIDNDQVFLEPHILRLRVEGFEVEQELTLTAGLLALKNNAYNLLILDVMMPIKKEEEEEFPEYLTNSGKKAGLVFFEKYKEILANKGITVLVLTIREEPEIRLEFINLNLPPENFMTKSEGADTAVFLAKVKQILGD